MRVFVALMLPDAVRRELVPQVEALRRLQPDLTWEAADRWHITLTFIGATDEALVEALRPRLERAASRTVRFGLSLDGVGRFGRRVLHAKLTGDRTSLRRLSERTSAAARREGVDAADGAEQRYRPHLTLARSRQGADLRRVVEAGSDLATAPWDVSEFVMVNSILGRERRYEVIGRYPLGIRGSARA